MHAHLVFEKRKSVYVVQTKIVRHERTKIVRHEQQCAQSVQDTMLLNIHQQQYYVIMLLFFKYKEKEKPSSRSKTNGKAKNKTKDMPKALATSTLKSRGPRQMKRQKKRQKQGDTPSVSFDMPKALATSTAINVDDVTVPTGFLKQIHNVMRINNGTAKVKGILTLMRTIKTVKIKGLYELNEYNCKQISNTPANW